MGTRAVIKYENEPMLATHWDGYPRSLGVDLVSLKKRTPEKVIEVASGHNIDLISPRFAPKKTLKIPATIYKGMGKSVKGYRITKFLTPEQMDKLGDNIGTFETKGNKDYKLAEVLPMSQYGDFAEWEYNIKDNKVYSRKIGGEYTKKRVESSWKHLPTTASAKKFEKDVYKKLEQDYVDKEVKLATKHPTYGAKQIMKRVGMDVTIKEGKFTTHYMPSYNKTLDDDEKKMVNTYLKIPKVKNLIGKGWHYESLRHRLASYGIKTKRN